LASWQQSSAASVADAQLIFIADDAASDAGLINDYLACVAVTS
jgi:hypothetical protein